MKITLEFEESDLRQMISNHFKEAGFTVNNLDEICVSFTAAFPQGLKVDAGILPATEWNDKGTDTGRISSAEPNFSNTPKSADDEPEQLPEPEDDDNKILTISDIMDPTPRRGRIEVVRKAPGAEEDADTGSIEKLVRQSKNLELSKRT